VLDHFRAILDFQPRVFTWPHRARTLWEEFSKQKTAGGLTFAGAFHRFRFGFANANVDNLDADLLQRLMRHQSQQTTRGYIDMAERLKRTGVADRLHVPAFHQAARG
jgi:integrase